MYVPSQAEHDSEQVVAQVKLIKILQSTHVLRFAENLMVDSTAYQCFTCVNILFFHCPHLILKHIFTPFTYEGFQWRNQLEAIISYIRPSKILLVGFGK